MNDDSITLRLSAQRALCGHVPASLRSASIQMDGDTIRWRCLFDTQATDDDFEWARLAGTEIIADFPPPTDIDEQIATTPFPQEMEHLGHIVFLRHEQNPIREEAEQGETLQPPLAALSATSPVT